MHSLPGLSLYSDPLCCFSSVKTHSAKLTQQSVVTSCEYLTLLHNI